MNRDIMLNFEKQIDEELRIQSEKHNEEISKLQTQLYKLQNNKKKFTVVCMVCGSTNAEVKCNKEWIYSLTCNDCGNEEQQ